VVSGAPDPARQPLEPSGAFGVQFCLAVLLALDDDPLAELEVTLELFGGDASVTDP
jgi:hypothetical protein